MDLSTIIFVSIGIILLILIPGFALSLALFPRKRDLDTVERIGLSFVLGLTPQFILYFGDKNLFIPVNFYTTLISIILTSFVGIVIWFFRREK